MKESKKIKLLNVGLLTMTTMLYALEQYLSFGINRCLDKFQENSFILSLLRYSLPLIILIAAIVVFLKTDKLKATVALSVVALIVHLSVSEIRHSDAGLIATLIIIVIAALILAAIKYFSPKLKKVIAALTMLCAVCAIVFEFKFIEDFRFWILPASSILMFSAWSLDMLCYDDYDENDELQGDGLFMGTYEAQLENGMLLVPEEFRPLMTVGQSYFVESNEDGVEYTFENAMDSDNVYSGEVPENYSLFVPDGFIAQNEGKALNVFGLMNGFVLSAAENSGDSEEIAELLKESGI